MRLVVLSVVLTSCSAPPPQPSQPIYIQSAPPAAMPMPVMGAPAAAMPTGPAAPGQYVNHVGNPAAGQWAPDGTWRWHDPASKEASSTMGYLAAAGLGAAGGAALSYYFTKRHFEQHNPTGWSATANTREVRTHVDRHGKPISADEYRRRREQSERDRNRYINDQKAKLKEDRKRFEREKKRYEEKKRLAQQKSDKPAASKPETKLVNRPAEKKPLKQSGGSYAQQPQPKPKWTKKAKKPLGVGKWNKKRRR